MRARHIVQVLKNKNFVHVRRYSTRLSYYHEAGDEPLSGITIGQLFDNCVEKHSHREAVVSIHENKRITYEESKILIDRLTTAFIASGLEVGDKLGIWVTNRTEWYLTFVAAAKAGLILTNINPMYQIPEIEYCINKANIKALVIDSTIKTQNYYDMLCRLIPELATSIPGALNSRTFPQLKNVIMITDDKLGGVIRFKDLTSYSAEPDTLRNRALDVNVDHPFNIQFTSGTTGKPKAATTSQHNVLNNSHRITKRLELHRKHHKICIQVPFFHAFGITPTLSGSMHWGCTLVLPSRIFSPTNSLRALESERCTVLYGTPSMYIDIINKQKELNLDINPEIALSGGAPNSAFLFGEMKKVLKLRKVLTLYGLTETTAGAFVSCYDDSFEQITTTVGKVLDHTEVKVIDSAGKTLPFGTTGELCTRGYCNMLGYWDDEAKTKEMISNDRWLRTGDQFVLHENGYGTIKGRLKDMIIRGGENIYPREIEDFLIHHPAINEIQVVGVPDERLGEEVCAFVILNNGMSLTLEEVKEFCHEKITYYKIPRYLRIVTKYPKTTSGKVQKIKLIEMFNELK